jgi:heme A synthase
MYTGLFHFHSFWAYLVLLVVGLATINALAGYFTKRSYSPNDFRISLFALIASHIQLLLGIVLFFKSPKILWFQDNLDVGTIMKDPLLRLYNVEHPTLMIIAVVLITMGYSKHKKKLSSTPKLKTLAIFYTLALIAILLMIPWNQWL